MNFIARLVWQRKLLGEQALNFHRVNQAPKLSPRDLCYYISAMNGFLLNCPKVFFNLRERVRAERLKMATRMFYPHNQIAR